MKNYRYLMICFKFKVCKSVDYITFMCLYIFSSRGSKVKLFMASLSLITAEAGEWTRIEATYETIYWTICVTPKLLKEQFLDLNLYYRLSKLKVWTHVMIAVHFHNLMLSWRNSLIQFNKSLKLLKISIMGPLTFLPLINSHQNDDCLFE